VEALLEQLRDELIGRTYQPLPARRQEKPKDGGKVRVLSIPAIRDRVPRRCQIGVFCGDFRPFISRILVSAGVQAPQRRLSAVLSPHPKIPFPVTSFEGEVWAAHLKPCSGFAVPQVGILDRALTLFRIKSEGRKLVAPLGRQIAQPLNADAAGQAAFYCSFDKIGREEGERDS
jgi:hypothetical protein